MYQWALRRILGMRIVSIQEKPLAVPPPENDGGAFDSFSNE